MQTVKIRRTGNSNAISLPRDFEQLGYAVGVEVVVAATPSGEVRILLQDRVRAILGEAGRAAEEGADAAGPPA